MGAVEERQSTSVDPWIGHVVGAGLGVVAAAAMVTLTQLEGHFRDQVVAEASAEPFWVLLGLYMLAGAITLVAVLVSRRMPLLATVAAVALGYCLLASVPSSLAETLPYPDWAPRLQWGLTSVALLTGVMCATAVWGWWSRRSRPAPRSRG